MRFLLGNLFCALFAGTPSKCVSAKRAPLEMRRHNDRMDISCSISYQANPQRVASALLSRELAEARAQALGISNYSCETDNGRSIFGVTVSPTQLPEKARAFVKNDVRVTVTAMRETLEGSDAAIPYICDDLESNTPAALSYSANIVGLPIKIHARMLLLPDGLGGTAGQVSGSLGVSLPFIGRKIEAMAAGRVKNLLERDAALVNRLLEQG